MTMGKSSHLMFLSLHFLSIMKMPIPQRNKNIHVQAEIHFVTPNT